MSEYIRKVKDGKIVIETPLFEDGDELVVQVEKLPKRRSLRANAYYFGAVVAAIVEKTGNTKESVHEYLKMELNPKDFPSLKFPGEFTRIGGSTREMTSAEFAEFVDKAVELAKWAGCQIGTIDSYWDMLLKESESQSKQEE